ncbi:MAG: type II secretion system protein [Candidatus Doudnabacteria bacterium]
MPNNKFQIPNKISNFKIGKSQSAFTLIETVVATAVFAFVVTSILGVYISTIQLDRKSRAQRAVAQDARFIMEFLAKEVRNGTINYPSYASSTVSGTSDLYIQNQANVVEHFFLSGTNMLINKGGANANMNSSGTKVTNLLFYIQPTTDPYTPAKSANDQPHVTVVLDLQSNYGTAAKDTVTMSLQDSFAISRYTSRR